MFLFLSTRKNCEISGSPSSVAEIFSLPEGCNAGLSYRQWSYSSACLPTLALFRLYGSCEYYPRGTLLYLTFRFHTTHFLPPASNTTLHVRKTTVIRSEYCQCKDTSLHSTVTPIIIVILVGSFGCSQPSQTSIHSPNFDIVHIDLGQSSELFQINHSMFSPSFPSLVFRTQLPHGFSPAVFHPLLVTEDRMVSRSKYSQRYYPSRRSLPFIPSTRAIQRVRFRVSFTPKGSRFRKQQSSVYSSSHIVQIISCTPSPYFCNHKIRIHQSLKFSL